MAEQNARDTTAQVGKFGLVGVMNTVIDYLIFISLTKFFAIPLSRVWIAKLISGSVAMLNSFYFNRRWVFKHDGANLGRQAIRFLVATVVSVYVIQLGLVQFFSSNYQDVGKYVFTLADRLGIIGLDPGRLTEDLSIKTTAFALATLVSLIWNFFLYKYWVFEE